MSDGLGALLARRIEEEGMSPEVSISVAELHRRLLPYPLCRSRAGIATKAEYDLKLLRLLTASIRDLSDSLINLRAMSMVYTTLLSLVPLLAVSFSVLKAFGVHNQMEPMLANFLAPLGPKGVEITHRIIGFVENLNVGVLGSLGLAMLVYTVISLIQKMEEAFNEMSITGGPAASSWKLATTACRSRVEPSNLANAMSAC